MDTLVLALAYRHWSETLTLADDPASTYAMYSVSVLRLVMQSVGNGGRHHLQAVERR